MSLFLIAAIMLIGMSVYTLAKQAMFPHMSSGYSHGLTIVLSSLIATIAAYSVLRQYHQILEHTLRELMKQKLEKQELRKHLSYLETLINTIPGPIFYKDVNGVYQGCNVTFAEQILGIPKERVVGRTLYDLPDAIPYELADVYHKQDSELLQQGGTQIYEAPVQCTDGLRRDFVFYKAAFSDYSGRAMGVVGVMLDISDRKQAEDALKKSENRYRNLFENSPISLWELDWSQVKEYLEGIQAAEKFTDVYTYFQEYPESTSRCLDLIQVNDVNKATLELCEAQEKYELREYRKNIIPEQSMGEFEEILFALNQGKQQFQSEMLLGTISGKMKHVALYLNVVPGYEKSLGKVLLSILDITRQKQANEKLRIYRHHLEEIVKGRTIELTQANKQLLKEISERKRTEQALRKSEAHYRTLFEESPISLWEEDFSEVKAYIDTLRDAGVTDFRRYFEQHPEVVRECASLVKIVRINKATLELYGIQSKEEFGNGLNNIFTKESYRMFQEELIAITQGNTVLQGESKGLTLTGKKIYFELWWIVAPSYEETLSKVLISIINITERKQAEMRLKKTMDKLKRSNAELEQFAYVASHDLQQPLLIIELYAQLLEQRYEKQLDEEGKGFIERIKGGAERMQYMIKALLDYSRLDAKVTKFRPTNCEDVLDKALANLQIVIEESNIVITHSSLPTVMAHDAHLVQLFQNLLSNAIKFRQEETPRVHVSAEQELDKWIFSVQDNGIGLDPEEIERAFIIFERLHNKKKYPGSGIGLATCKKIVERHGGDIWVTSEPGKGSTFFFSLPIDSDVLPENAQDEHDEHHGK